MIKPGFIYQKPKKQKQHEKVILYSHSFFKRFFA